MKLPFFKRTKALPDKDLAAIAKAREAAARNPQDPRLRIKLAELLLAGGNKVEAVTAYCEAAQAYDAAGKNRIVTAIYQHVLSIDPGNIAVYRLLVDAFLKEYLIGDAVETMVRLATYYYDNGHHYEAAQTIKEITAIDPDNRFYKTKVEKFLNERNLSLDSIEKIGPKDKWTLVQPQATPAEHTEGFVDLERILDNSSIDIVITEEPDAAATPEGRTPEEVLDQIKSLVTSDAEQNTPEFHYTLGLAFMNRGDYDHACHEFAQATDSAAHRIDAYHCLITCSRKLGRYGEAAKAAEAALRQKGLTDADRCEFLYEQGLVYKELGRRNDALKIFKMIYKIDKNFRSVAREIKELS
ncbi:MAG: tetratricopeptide repeat protein [Desulfobacterota bacterium]|nr:tetratricopeptide repeat protein [Thermodesulfobacteriota bacterium]